MKMGIASVEQFRHVLAEFWEWKAWLHMIGKYQRHNLGSEDTKPNDSRYMTNGMAAIDSWCKRNQWLITDSKARTNITTKDGIRHRRVTFQKIGGILANIHRTIFASGQTRCQLSHYIFGLAFSKLEAFG